MNEIIYTNKYVHALGGGGGGLGQVDILRGSCSGLIEVHLGCLGHILWKRFRILHLQSPGNCILCVQLLSKINMLERLRHFVRITYVFLLATVIPALYDSSAILNISP